MFVTVEYPSFLKQWATSTRRIKAKARIDVWEKTSPHHRIPRIRQGRLENVPQAGEMSTVLIIWDIWPSSTFLASYSLASVSHLNNGEDKRIHLYAFTEQFQLLTLYNTGIEEAFNTWEFIIFLFSPFNKAAAQSLWSTNPSITSYDSAILFSPL